MLEVRIPVFLMMTFRSSSSLNPNSSDSHSLAGLKRRCCLVADEHARRSAPGRSLDRWGGLMMRSRGHICWRSCCEVHGCDGFYHHDDVSMGAAGEEKV